MDFNSAKLLGRVPSTWSLIFKFESRWVKVTMVGLYCSIKLVFGFWVGLLWVLGFVFDVDEFYLVMGSILVCVCGMFGYSAWEVWVLGSWKGWLVWIHFLVRVVVVASRRNGSWGWKIDCQFALLPKLHILWFGSSLMLCLILVWWLVTLLAHKCYYCLVPRVIELLGINHWIGGTLEIGLRFLEPSLWVDCLSITYVIFMFMYMFILN